MSLYDTRRRVSSIYLALCYGAAAFGLGWLVLILIALFWNGLAGLSLG